MHSLPLASKFKGIPPLPLPLVSKAGFPAAGKGEGKDTGRGKGKGKGECPSPKGSVQQSWLKKGLCIAGNCGVDSFFGKLAKSISKY